jgi:predicted O-methyltransferase YrrM
MSNVNEQSNNHNVSSDSLMILVANLERRKDRRFVIEQYFPSIIGVPLEFIKAVDGETIPRWKVERRIAHLNEVEIPKSSSYAVRITKMLAIRKFLRSDKDYLLFLEDDVWFPSIAEFEIKLVEAMNLNKELVFLGGGHKQKPIGDGPWRKCVATYNNQCILFNRRGAKKVIRALSEWKESWSDSEIQRMQRENYIDAWCAHPFLAPQRTNMSDNWGHKGTADVWLGEMKPMLPPEDLAILHAALIGAESIVEFGSGGSTVSIVHHLDKRGSGHLTTIEHDPEWIKSVLSAIPEKMHSRLKLILREPTPRHPKDGPWRFMPGQMRHYVKTPWEVHAPGSVDMMHIDGRERIACAMTNAPLIKPGGLMLIHDFFPRHRYRAYLSELLTEYEFLFESPFTPGENGCGYAVFRKR